MEMAEQNNDIINSIRAGVRLVEDGLTGYSLERDRYPVVLAFFKDVRKLVCMSDGATGAELIATERQRQLVEEEYTPERDNICNGNSQLVLAAACYALKAPPLWPWSTEWYKPVPDDRVRELVKAGALIAAEIDRLLVTKGVDK
jgi:hypothetical protein